MTAARTNLLRTTVVQAFARTVAADTHRSAMSESGGVRARISAPTTDRDSIPIMFDDDSEPDERVAHPALPSIGDVVGGHYKLVRVLGEGMFGKVYVAQRLDVPEHQVAMKILPRSLYASRNVERELVMLATVGHPHVVQMKDHGTTPDYVWLTMPVYQGQTLAERLEKGTLSPTQAHDIFLPVARGLEALHAAGLRHQDVKPENIFLAVFGGRVHPILLDLGVAAEKEATFVAGTALFGAPEQVVVLAGLPAFQPLTEKMDTYGLAATLLMALVGPKDFPGESATSRSELAEAQDLRTKEPLSPRALPEVTGEPREMMQAAFRHWLAFAPDDRPTMKQLAEQLEVLLEPDREEVRQEERRRARQRTTIQRLKLGVAGLLLIGAAGAVVAYNQRETLRIAADLENARMAGAKSFNELGTCNAAHAQATKAVAECSTARDTERANFKRELDHVMHSGSTTQADYAREVQRFNNRLKTCEDGATQAKRTCDDEAAKVAANDVREKVALATQRDEAKRLADDEKAELATLGAERDQCRAERATCVEERDVCRSQTKTPGAPRAPASGTSAPSAGPSAPPAPPPMPGGATGEPGVPPEPAPQAPPPPPAPPPAAPPAPPAPPQPPSEPKASQAPQAPAPAE